MSVAGGLFSTQRAWQVRALIVIIACAGALGIEWLRPAPVERIDEGIRDLALRFFASPAPEERIAIVDLDEASLDAQPWPWPRARLADLVEALLVDYGAASVTLDVVLPEAADAAGDARLASLASHAPLVLAQIIDYEPRLPPLLQGALAGGTPAAPEAAPLPGAGFMANHAGLGAARCVGNIGYLPDADGLLRRLPLITRLDGKDYPHLALALLRCLGKEAPPALLAATTWRLPYHQALAAYRVVPAALPFTGEGAADLLRGRHVFVGSSALALGDRVSTPLAPLAAGVSVHAAAFTALLDIEAGRLALPWSGRALLAGWLVVSCALAGWLIAGRRAIVGASVIVALAVFWLAAALYGAERQAEWSITAPLWGYALLFLGGVPFELWLAQKRTQRAIDTLGHYVSSQVLHEILRADLEHSLRPKLCEVTVLIADIEGYTRLTSSLPLAAAARLTKEVLECLTQPLLAAGGTLDKYSGDGLVSFWGAPLACPEQADIAVATALAMQTAIAAYNQGRPAGTPPVRVRIGIESGAALVGDLGTTFRSTYTAVGDCINFASRLESAARDRASPILIGPEANRRLRRFTTEAAGVIKVRGTEKEIAVFSIAPGEEEK